MNKQKLSGIHFKNNIRRKKEILVKQETGSHPLIFSRGEWEVGF